MIDKKWLRYQAILFSKKHKVEFDEAYEQVMNDPQLGKANEFLKCTICGVLVKGKNLSFHQNRHIPVQKIKWRNIPIIKQQIARKKRLTKLAGKPKTQIVSGGLPSLGKKK